jgi:UDP-GlcNAc3NAcA epimerase
MKIITVVGARPQFIKAAAVSRAISKKKNIQEFIVHTGQHYDHNMSDIFFNEMEIPHPHCNLEINGCTHGEMTGLMLQKIEALLISEKPDWVLVYGDTNSTLAGALAAAKLHIPVAHVEAGLRSFNKRMPEEINRILTDHSSDVLFTPTRIATDQLKKESFPCEKVHQVGDVMYDASLYYRERLESRESIIEKLHLKPKQFVLATMHRQENTDHIERLTYIVQGLIEVAKTRPVVFPIPEHVRRLNAMGFYSRCRISCW